MSRLKFILCLVPLVLIGCLNSSDGDSTTIAKVGRHAITSTDINTRIQNLNPQLQEFFSKKENQSRLVDQIIDEEVLFQLASKEGFAKDKEYKTLLNDLKRQTLINYFLKKKIDDTISISNEEVETFYNENKAQYAAYKTRDLSHILVEKKAEATKVKRLLKKGRSFAELAKKYSIDPSKDNGGNLGFVRASQLVPEFSKAAFKLSKKYPVSGVVKTQFGYHIIKFNSEKSVDAQPLNTVYESISQQLTNQKKRTAFNEMITAGKDSIKIEKIEPQSDDSN